MDLRNILLFVTTGLNLGLSFFIFAKGPKNKANIWFSLMLFFIAVWSFEMSMFRMANSETSAAIWLNLYYLAAAFIAPSFYLFCRFFPFEIKRVGARTYWLAVTSTAIITAIILYRGVTTHVYLDLADDHTVDIIYGNYLLYTVYFVSYVGASFFHLLAKIKTASSYHKKLLRVVFGATLLAAVAGSFFDLFLPLATYRYIWIGPYFTAIMVLIIVQYIFIKNVD